MIKLLKKLSSNSGVDGAIALTILSRLVQAAGGVGSVVFIAHYLTADEQGYYYTFASIIAIQVFFELGLSGIITQYTAHEFAHLHWKGQELEGNKYYSSRLSSLLHFCVKWFGILAIFLFFLLFFVGFYFFNTFNSELAIDWQFPWVILCLSTSLNLFIDPILAYFDGLGEVKDMAQIRVVQKTIMVFLLFVFFMLGFKLYSGALASLIAILVNYIQICFSGRLAKLKLIWKLKSDWVINYMKEIFPLQWKIALSWVSGYFIFQLFNPVLFATEGPVVAGQMGMTLQALNGISSISMSWISTKVPVFSGFIARKQYDLLDQMFNKTLKSLLIVNLFLIFILLTVVVSLNILSISYSQRFLPIFPTIVLSLTCFFNQFVFSWATYLRCHKSEPFLIQSIVVAVLASISTLFLGKQFGLMGIVMGYGFIMLTVSFFWAYSIFTKKKREWHLPVV